MRDRHKAAARFAARERLKCNNKCQRLGVSVIFAACWLFLLTAAHQQDNDDDDKWAPSPPPLPQAQQEEINSTANLQDAANQTAANGAKLPVLAELNADASDTVPVYMQHMTIILCTLHLSVFVTGLVGNSLVCLSVYRNKSLQTITNYYIVNLAVADFLVILICLPPTVYWDLTLTWNFGQVLCKLVLYLQSISVSVSVLTLTCISIDRWYAICRPLKFSSSKSRAKLTIALIWLASLLIASPDVIFLTTSKLYEGEGEIYTDCTYSWPENNTKMYQLCIVTLLFILPFVLMIISYSQIVNVLWRNETMAESMQNSFHLEDETATAASLTNGRRQLKRRSAKNESVISATTSMAVVTGGGGGGGGSGHQDNNNGAPRHRWLRRRTKQAPAEQCADDRLCSTCATAAAAPATSTRLSPSNSSNATNASYLVTPSGSFSFRPRSFAILKLCRRTRTTCNLPKQLGPSPAKINTTRSATADDAQTTGQLVAANIQSHRVASGEPKSNLTVCQFERCMDLKCLNSARGGGNVDDENALVKFNVNNSSPNANCSVGLLCSAGPVRSKLDENMEISAGSLVNRAPPFAADDGFAACASDNNVSVQLSTGELLAVAATTTSTTIWAKQPVDGEPLLGQYDNEHASLSPTSTPADKIEPEITGPSQGGRGRWTKSSALLLSFNNNDDDDDVGNLVLGPNYCEHASRPASSGGDGPRAKCLPTTSRAEKQARACDWKSSAAAAAESAITKSCKLHAAADCAQCHADNHENNNNDDDHDGDHHHHHHNNHHQNENNRCHGCRQHQLGRSRRHRRQQHKHHHRRRRATCHELQGPSSCSPPLPLVNSGAKIIITEIKESESRPVILANGANHKRCLDVETNGPCGPNEPNGNYYTRGGRRATTPAGTRTMGTQNLVDRSHDEADDMSSGQSSSANNPTGQGDGRAVAIIESTKDIKFIESRPPPTRGAISAGRMAHVGQNREPITTSGRVNELSETAMQQLNCGPSASERTKCHGKDRRPGQLECGDDENNDAATRLHEQTAVPAAPSASIRPKRNKPNRHYHDHHHHHHHCRRKHTDPGRRCRHRKSRGGQSVGGGDGGASLSLAASDATPTASMIRGKDKFSTETTTTGPRCEAAKITSARHYCAECMPTGCDCVGVAASSPTNIFALTAGASETGGRLNDAANRKRALSCSPGEVGPGEQVAVSTRRSTGNGPARPLVSVVATMAAPAATEIVSRIEAKRGELDTGKPLVESLKWSAGHLAHTNASRRGGQLECAGSASSVATVAAKDEEQRNLLFIANGVRGSGDGEGDICARAASGHETGLRQSMKQDNSSSNNNKSDGRCTWRSSNIRAATGSAARAAMRKGLTYERAGSSSGREGQGWCLDCCDTHEGLSPADPPTRADHHYRQEPLSELATSALSKQQQQQQQHEGGGRPVPISCADNRPSNGRLSVKLAPAMPDLNLDQDDDAGNNNKSSGREAKTKPLRAAKTAGPRTASSSLQSINQADDNQNRTSTRTAVTCMVANKFLYIRRFVRLVPSAANGNTSSTLSSSPGNLSGRCLREKDRASKCRVCRRELNCEPSQGTEGLASCEPLTTMSANESHAQQTTRQQRQQYMGHAPARVSGARSASGSVHANGSASHQQHAQIHNRSSAPPLQGASSASPSNAAAKSCSLVVQTASQQQHNHYPNHHQPQTQQHPHPHPNHSSTRFYKLIESRKKAAKMLIVIVIMFGLCYLPIHFLNTLRYTTGLPQNDITTIASLVSHWLCYFNSAVNPLIYNFMSGKFRHEFANLFFCRFLRRATTNNQNQNHYQN